MEISYIALGSNLGNRRQNITHALTLLKKERGIVVLGISSLIETAPVGGPAQPLFLNGVVKIKTAYTPGNLLKKLQQIEIKLGRPHPHAPNYPRTIDLDILLYGRRKIKTKNLTLPHPRMWQRQFITAPLKEIAPELFKNKR
ncbi:MAG: 2-amino-4-hydroxy-6-hydroxymethyldihydropteridine diphosphokinase [Candidatus Omnitrophota bacterium]